MVKNTDVFTLLLLFSLCSAQNITTQKEALDYLERFGYINKSDIAITDYERVLIDFQERYNLQVDGKLNEPTLHLMNKPRCHFSENAFRVQSKWNKTHLKWYFPQANLNKMYLDVANKAFQIWERNSTLTFENVFKPPADITISVVNRVHKYRYDCGGDRKCPEPFDGPGKVLAHGDYPYNDQCVEIHIDREEKWYFGDEEVPAGEYNLLMVLVHEIGHTLGLDHSDNENAIMYPWYQEQNKQLFEDDIMGLEALYGRRNKYVPIPKHILTSTTKKPASTTKNLITTAKKATSTTKISTPTTKNPTSMITTSTTKKPTSTIKNPTSTVLPKTNINLCNIKIPDFMFLATAPTFPNFRLYVGYNTFLWKLDLNDMQIPSSPEHLNDYLPNELKSSQISHIFQNSVGNLITYNKIKRRCYAASFPDLNIQDDYDLLLPAYAHINTMFQTNSGKNFVFYDNTSYIEFIDNPREIITRGRINDQFPGIPSDLTSAFRFIDGYIYFFNKNTYYKFSEYTRKVVEAGPFSWNLFGVPCPDESLLNQLKTMLTKLISFYE